MKNDDSASSKKGRSKNGMTKSINRIGFRAGGNRDLTVRLPNMRSARSKNAKVLIVHPNPI